MDEKNDSLIVPENTSPEIQAESGMTDEQLEDFAGGLTMVKDANCSGSKGSLNSVVTLEASLKL